MNRLLILAVFSFCKSDEFWWIFGGFWAEKLDNCIIFCIFFVAIYDQFKSGQGWAKPSFMAIFARFLKDVKNFDEKKFEKIDEKWQKKPTLPTL